MIKITHADGTVEYPFGEPKTVDAVAEEAKVLGFHLAQQRIENMKLIERIERIEKDLKGGE